MSSVEFIPLSLELDRAGLYWEPEIGDEVTERESLDRVAILVDPQGLSPNELRESFIWLPTVEQLVDQIILRGGILYHVGLTEASLKAAPALRNVPHYEAVIKTASNIIEVSSPNLRIALGQTLYQLLQQQLKELIH